MTPVSDMGNTIVQILRDRRFWLGPAPQVILLLAAVNSVVLSRKSIWAEEKRANLTTGDVAAYGQARRCDHTWGEDLLSTWDTIPDATQQPLAILCGMSQMMTINDRQPGDQQTSEELDDRLSARGIRVHGLAAPNLCNEEGLFLLVSLLAQPQTTPRSFVFGACFDKFRNIDLRPGYQKFFAAKPRVAAAWKQTAEEYRERYPLAADKMLKTLRDLHRTDEPDRPASDGWESELRDLVSVGVPLVAERKALNGKMQNELYEIRNQLLRIKNTSKRPIIRARYDMNREFFELMIDVSRKAGVRFITYVIPLNPQADNPYVPQEYTDFKIWLEQLTAAQRVPFANLENLVPAEEWGLWKGGPDFKHFKGAGHRLVAAKLVDEFGPLLGSSAETEAGQ
jgi:hypothetical protein